MELNFQRYLAAKRTVDDRALNRWVWNQMASLILERQQDRPVSILEIGAGIGTMFQRMLEWGALRRGSYTLLDALPENLAAARAEMIPWAQSCGLAVTEGADGALHLDQPGQALELRFAPWDVQTFIREQAGQERFDLLVAHAVLDLLDIPKLLPGLAALVDPGGWLYLTVNFDGVTIFEPISDPVREERILGLYHRSMEERTTGGEPSGDSRAGRHLFEYLAQNHLEILAAGSSDWVVYPAQGSYPADEAYFLGFILHFFEESLGQHPDLEPGVLQGWLAERRRQIERGELVYLAHQIDFLARRIF